ncbi:MAG: GIY-YIG nuclease family protein [Fusobacteriaceae bacterium]
MNLSIHTLLTEVEKIKNGDNIRIHLAKNDGTYNPLNAIVNDQEWKSWQEYNRQKVNRFPDHVKYIITFAQYSSNEFLYGGIFEILGRNENGYYVVEKTNLNKELDKRFIIEYFGSNKRGTVFKLDYFQENSKISYLLKNKYSGITFPGLENINHSAKELYSIFEKQIKEWKLPLINSKGIYLLLDTKTNKKYIGSANGENGFWGRWLEYIYNGNGGNKQLVELSQYDENYFRDNFKFSILEVVASNFSDEAIEVKESKWKDKLNTRGEFGYNSN